MLIFFDESGDSGMKQKPGSSLFFVVTAILFEEHEEAEKCEQAICSLRQRLHLHEQFEFISIAVAMRCAANFCAR